MATRKGLEPSISAVTGRHVNHYTTGPCEIWRRHPDSNWGVEVLQTSALPLGYAAKEWSGKRDSNSRPSPWQGDALPLSYFRIMATSMGFEPTLSAVTGRHVNHYTTGPKPDCKIYSNRYPGFCQSPIAKLMKLGPANHAAFRPESRAGSSPALSGWGRQTAWWLPARRAPAARRKNRRGIR